MEPDVSLPTLAAQKLAAVPTPELEPPVIIGGHGSRRARHPIGELGEAGLGDDHRSGVSKIFHQRGVVRRGIAVENQGASGGDDVVGEDIILECNGNPVQGAANASLRPLAVALVGFLEHMRVDGDHAMKLVLVQADAGEVQHHQLARGQAARFHGRAHGRDSGLDHVERFRRAVGSEAARNQRGGDSWQAAEWHRSRV